MSYSESILIFVKYYGLAQSINEINTEEANRDICSLNSPGQFVLYWNGMNVGKRNGEKFNNIGISKPIL